MIILIIIAIIIMLGFVCAVWLVTWSLFEDTKFGQIIIEKIEKTITIVHCDFTDCIYNIDGKCSKKEIYLDNRVNDIFTGCPDAEWENNGNIGGINDQERTT